MLEPQYHMQFAHFTLGCIYPGLKNWMSSPCMWFETGLSPYHWLKSVRVCRALDLHLNQGFLFNFIWKKSSSPVPKLLCKMVQNANADTPVPANSMYTFFLSFCKYHVNWKTSQASSLNLQKQRYFKLCYFLNTSWTSSIMHRYSMHKS